ncbi:MAG: response regulator [Leptospiraceae bacterium]|nr:response regulator [Leptospiraceae bacterium]MCP5494815.1 response regulator [Leptospiraceae bacterium]
MVKKFFSQSLIFIFFLFFICFCSDSKRQPVVQKGTIDLSDWNFKEDGIVKLDGEWEFYWNKLYTHQDFQELDIDPDVYVKFPSTWNGLKIKDKELSGYGYATYRINIKLNKRKQSLAIRSQAQATNFAIFINGREVIHSGKVGKSETEAVPESMVKVAYLPPISDSIELIMHVSNYHHRKGGIWMQIFMGSHGMIEKQASNIRGIDIFLAGTLFIMFLHHLGLYLIRKNDLTSLLFSLFCIDIFFRIISTGDRILALQLSLPYEFVIKVEYFTFFMALPIAIIFLYYTFPRNGSVWINYTFLFIAIAFCIFTLFTPVRVFSYLIPIYQPIFLVGCIVGLGMLVRAIIHKEEGSVIVLVGFLIMLGTSVNDILFTHEIVKTGFIAPVGMLFMIFTQSFMLSRKFSKAFFTIENLSLELMKTNQAYSRFVPNEFLSLLDKKSIVDIEIGDQTQKEMTILFSDIRGFTTLSENMTPEENFKFINSYLSRMEPIISQHNGFIDKYIGDAIMALFAGTADDALKASIDILQELKQYNLDRQKVGYVPIQIGIGLNTGNLMLGTVGGKGRMDGTVISDAVNLASRVETLTKTFHVSLIVSENVITRLQNANDFLLREIDKVKVKGKETSTTLYECFNADPPELIEKKIKSLEFFSEGLVEFRSENILKAKELFISCQKICPEDPIPAIYINRCNEYIARKDVSNSGIFSIESTISDNPLAMVVDDNTSILQFMEMFLSRNQFDVLLAKNVGEAIQKYSLFLPNVVLIDAHISNVDSLDIVKQIRNLSRNNPPKIILLTQKSDIDREKEFYALGVNTCLPKPIRAKQLLKTLTALVS